ncbi:hypothetical protein SAMN05421783_1509 [Thiocapsa roseopersicina]|uniref:Uncharacterized protein n=1 Tax=Thiocapsa roseopersicina TaxID=1058 RepID=A0A1H3DJ28_THIRO|nr:hypothetical protein SAMN05421783_1509 [Thiocapsa roseopersicina]
MQLLQPPGVVDVGLAPRHRLDVAGIGDDHANPACLEDFVESNPVHPRRRHGDRRDPAGDQPVREAMQIAGEAPESENRVSLLNPSGGSCGRTDSLLGDDLFWPRFAPLRAVLRHDVRQKGAVGLRTALRRIMGWSAPFLQRALSGHNERCV